VNELGFIGPLKKEMSTFILLKRSIGNKYRPGSKQGDKEALKNNENHTEFC